MFNLLNKGELGRGYGMTATLVKNYSICVYGLAHERILMAQLKSNKQIAYASLGLHEKELIENPTPDYELRAITGIALTDKRVAAIQEVIKTLAKKRYEFYRDYLAKKDIAI